MLVFQPALDVPVADETFKLIMSNLIGFQLEQRVLLLDLWDYILKNDPTFHLVMSNPKNAEKIITVYLQMVFHILINNDKNPRYNFGQLIQEWVFMYEGSESAKSFQHIFDKTAALSLPTTNQESIVYNENQPGFSVHPADLGLDSDALFDEVIKHCETVNSTSDMFIETLNFNQGHIGDNSLARELHGTCTKLKAANDIWIQRCPENNEAALAMLIAAGEKLHTAFQTLVNITESQRLELARLELEQAKAKVMALENPQIPVQQSKPNPATYSATNPFNTYVQQQQQQQQQQGAPQPDFNPYLPSAIQQSDNPYMSNGHVPAQSYPNKVQVTNTEGSAYERAYNSSNPFGNQILY
ncbi:hypothetical protein HDV02_005362 [Globomyces sp. JEL0801]|nr:hypothetical protein HDV02_005362 [Globomyces sp. JEL0801]